MSAILSSGWEKNQADRDRLHEKQINSIRGTEDYVVPGTNDYVQLPDSYENVYANDRGEYLLTNDALYDPNTDPNLSGSWQAMKVRP